MLAKLRWLAHGFSTRSGGTSTLEGKPALNLGFTEWDERERVTANREDISLTAIGAREMPLVTLRQFHSDVIHLAAAPCAEAPKADALITKHSQACCSGVQTADLRADPPCGHAAAMSSPPFTLSWRGTLARASR